MATHPLADGAALPHGEHPHIDWPYRRSAAKRYGVAVLAVIVACALRYVLYGDLSMRLAFTFFVPAAIVAAWYGGLGPGMLATVSGLLVGIFFVLSPRSTLALGDRELMAVAVYTVTTMLCVILCEHLHHRIRRIEQALDRERHAPTNPALQPNAVPQQGSPFRRSFVARFGGALGVVALAFALRYWMFGTQDNRFPFLFFVPAAMIATWYGGMAPGLLAAVAGLMLGDYFFLSEHEALGPVRENERLAIGLYAVTTTLCVLLIENLHTRFQRTEHALDHARHHRHKPHPDSPADSAFSH